MGGCVGGRGVHDGGTGGPGGCFPRTQPHTALNPAPFICTPPTHTHTHPPVCLPACLLQGVVQPVTAVSCAAVALAPIYNYLLIFKLGFGLDGAAYAMVLAHASMLLMLSAYLVWRERQRLGTPEQSWHGWWVALRCAALCCAALAGQRFLFAGMAGLAACFRAGNCECEAWHHPR